MKKINVRITKAEREWIIDLYKDLYEHSIRLARPDLAARSLECAEKAWKKQPRKRKRKVN